MNRNKQLELTRRNNASLTQKLEEAKTELELNKMVNAESFRRAKELISELELIKKKWSAALNDLYEKQAEYDRIIEEVRGIRKRMKQGRKIKYRTTI